MKLEERIKKSVIDGSRELHEKLVAMNNKQNWEEIYDKRFSYDSGDCDGNHPCPCYIWGDKKVCDCQLSEIKYFIKELLENFADEMIDAIPDTKEVKEEDGYCPPFYFGYNRAISDTRAKLLQIKRKI